MSADLSDAEREAMGREWTAIGEQAGAARAGETMWNGPFLKPGECLVVVPKSRALAAEERERLLREALEGLMGEARAYLEPAGASVMPAMAAARTALAASPGQPEETEKGLIPMDDETRQILEGDARPTMPDRADALSGLLDGAFDALLWISEHPNRTSNPDPSAVALAERARDACAAIERGDPDRENEGP